MKNTIDPTPKAIALADRPYTVVVENSELIDGTPCYAATHPELPGCIGSGLTPEDAIADLSDARKDYIQSMLDDGLPVPDPQKPSVSFTWNIPPLKQWLPRLRWWFIRSLIGKDAVIANVVVSPDGVVPSGYSRSAYGWNCVFDLVGTKAAEA